MFSYRHRMKTADVLKRFLNRLETEHCKVCYHLNDFVPGETIINNIQVNMMKSKRVLCFLSRSFLRSGPCNLEFSTAYNLDTHLRKKRLVVLMIEQIATDEPEIPPAIRSYLRPVHLHRTWPRELVGSTDVCDASQQNGSTCPTWQRGR